jgi:hypothetical protein
MELHPPLLPQTVSGSIFPPTPDGESFFDKSTGMFCSSKQRFLSLLLFLALSVFVTLPNAGAQVDDREKAEQAAAKQKELEKNSLKLLDEVISGAWSLKLPANRSYVFSTAAELLWPHDEKRARGLFWEALNSMNLPASQATDMQNTKQPNDSANRARATAPTKEQQEQINRYYATLEIRSDFLRKVARRDPQLALDMMRSTRPAPPQIPGMARFDPDAALEQEITFAAAANDPKRAVQLARESMAKGLTGQILNLINSVAQKDQDAATQLTDELVAKLGAENLSTNSHAWYLAMQMLELSRADGGGVLQAGGSLNAPVKRLKLTDDQKRSLVETLTDAALSVTMPPAVLMNMPFIMPEIEQYAPDRVAKLKARLTEFNHTLPPAQRDWNDFNVMFENATPEEMIRASRKMNADQRAALFYRAAEKAIERNEADRYRELIDAQIENEDERKVALDSLNNQRMYYDISQGKTDDLEKVLPLIRAREQRASAMVQLAMMLEKKDQHDEAVKLLDEARSLVKLDLTNEQQSNALLEVMFGYALVDPPKAFAMIEPIVDRTNEEVSKMLPLDKIVKSGAVKDGEIILQQSRLPLELSMMKYSPGLVVLGKADFDRTKALADRFQRNELRVVARLLLAQALLKNLEQPLAQ